MITDEQVECLAKLWIIGMEKGCPSPELEWAMGVLSNDDAERVSQRMLHMVFEGPPRPLAGLPGGDPL